MRWVRPDPLPVDVCDCWETTYPVGGEQEYVSEPSTGSTVFEGSGEECLTEAGPSTEAYEYEDPGIEITWVSRSRDPWLPPVLVLVQLYKGRYCESEAVPAVRGSCEFSTWGLEALLSEYALGAPQVHEPVGEPFEVLLETTEAVQDVAGAGCGLWTVTRSFALTQQAHDYAVSGTYARMQALAPYDEVYVAGSTERGRLVAQAYVPETGWGGPGTAFVGRPYVDLAEDEQESHPDQGCP